MNPVIASAGVTLDASGTGRFAFTVPTLAQGEELTVELVAWTAPVSLDIVGAAGPSDHRGPVPSEVPAGEGGATGLATGGHEPVVRRAPGPTR